MPPCVTHTHTHTPPRHGKVEPKMVGVCQGQIRDTRNKATIVGRIFQWMPPFVVRKRHFVFPSAAEKILKLTGKTNGFSNSS